MLHETVQAVCALSALAIVLCVRRRRADYFLSISDTGHDLPTASPLQDVESGNDVAPLLTVIVTTSAVQSNPNTAMLETVLSSFSLVPGLDQCRRIIVCDGCRVAARARPRKGTVTADGAAAYFEFIERLKRLFRAERNRACADCDSSEIDCDDDTRVFYCTERQSSEPSADQNSDLLLVLGQRHGFGGAVEAALRHVRSPYVMVVQHDNNFIRGFDLGAVLRAMRRWPDVLKKVDVLSTTTLRYAHAAPSKRGMPGLRLVPFAPALEDEHEPLLLRPMLYWYDKTHICSTDYYRRFVFAPGSVKRGEFIEDCVGQRQLAAIRQHGMAAHAEYGVYLLEDERQGVQDDVCIRHLHGRKFMTDVQRKARGFPLAGRGVRSLGAMCTPGAT